MTNIDNSKKLWERAIELMPRGTQTMSKAPDQFVFGVHPIYLERGKGCEVQDVDGNWYIDYGCALGPIIFGHQHKRTMNAIKTQLKKGITFSLMSPVEVELAELLTEVIPCAEMVRFGKNGSDATSMAVRAARSYTGKEKILIPNGHYHGFHDFFAIIARPYGVPKCLKDLVKRFDYNNIESLREKITSGEFAAVLMEPVSLDRPIDGFLQEVRELCTKHSVILIFDEMITGFRWSLGGAQEYYNVVPDIATFGKAVANGMPISIVAGKKEYMKEFDHVFFSSTFGGEACSIAAAIETIKEMKEKRHKIFPHMWKQGDRLRNSFNKHAKKIGVDAEMFGFGPRHNIRFNTSAPEIHKDILHQELVKRGILMGTQIYVTCAHNRKCIDYTIDAMNKSLCIIADIIDSTKPANHFLEGECSAAIFKNTNTGTHK